MTERVFFDTNVLVYADDSAAKVKQKRARELITRHVGRKTAVVSTQVLQELYAACTKKLGLDAADARERVERYSRLDVVLIRPEHILAAIDLSRLRSLSFWDALVLRAAAAGGCARVMTEDLSHGEVIEGVQVENPFKA